MNNGDDPILPREATQNRPASGEKNESPKELPDYVEEEEPSSEPVPARGLSNPKNWTRLFVTIFLLLSLILVSPIYRSLKRWRADVLLGNAATAFAYGDNDRGISLLKQAMAIAPGSRSVHRAVELFNARSGDDALLKKILSRMRGGTSSVEELLGIAELEGMQGKKEIALEALSKLPAGLNRHQKLRLALIQAVMKEQAEGPVQAAALCLTAAHSMQGEEAARLKNQAAFYLLSDQKGDEKREGVEMLLGVMREKREASLAAARILARLSLSTDKKNGEMITPSEEIETAHLLPALPGHQLGDELLAADLAMHLDPSCKKDLIKRMSANYQHAPRSVMLDFARWLNTKGFHDEVIAFAGPERPQSDTDWLLIVLDAESAKGDWNGMSDKLDTSAGLGIPDAVKHLFLARIAMMTGEAAEAEEEWRSVSGSLHLEKPETLAYIAGYEEEIGAFDQALITYREMLNRKESHLSGLLGFIRLQPRSTDADTLIPLYEELLVAAPNFSDAAGDLAYLKLLKNRDVSEASASAEALLNAQPNSLARISAAALGRLKKGDAKGALALYESNHIDWTTAPDSWKAVYVAVLRASGNIPTADRLVGTIRTGGLRPEELVLIKYPTPH